MSNGPSGAGELSARQVGSLAGDLRASGSTAQSTASPKGPEPAPDQPITLEQQKLKAEIDEIRSRTQRPRTFSDKWLSGSITYLAIIAPIIVAGVGAWVGWKQYQDERVRLARFTVGKEVIDLATQLNDKSDSVKQALAAQQLAWFGRPAVYLLFEQLVAQDLTEVRRPIVMALAEIARGNTTTPSVLNELSQSTLAFAGMALEGPQPDPAGLKRRLTALVEVAAAIRTLDDSSATDYRDLLGKIRMRVESSPLPGEEKQALLDLVEQID